MVRSRDRLLRDKTFIYVKRDAFLGLIKVQK